MASALKPRHGIFADMDRSIIFAALGIIGEIISYDLTIWVLKPVNKAWAALHIISSILCFSGFALVLYSRLHFVIPHKHFKIRRGLLIMIVVNAIAFHVPVIVSTMISAYGDPLLGYRLYTHFVYFDVGFAGQDVLLSTVYVCYFWIYLHSIPTETSEDVKMQDRTTFRLVIVAYIVVLMTDVLALVLLGRNLLLARYTVLGLVLVLKLNVEYFVLNRLVKTSHRRMEILERGNLSHISNGSQEGQPTQPTTALGVSGLGDELLSGTSHHHALKLDRAILPSVEQRNLRDQNTDLREYSCNEDASAAEMAEANRFDDLERQYLGRF
jgi:hypothetical protein